MTDSRNFTDCLLTNIMAINILNLKGNMAGVRGNRTHLGSIRTRHWI